MSLVSRGAASCLFELALMVHDDADAIRRFVFENIPVWADLDRETLHPRDQAHA
ncbi:MAG: hypothetical protein IT487_19345 [Chromatiaceae bacterium]|nr:hypothetical protein [Chromatiaceae bacterium]